MTAKQSGQTGQDQQRGYIWGRPKSPTYDGGLHLMDSRGVVHFGQSEDKLRETVRETNRTYY